MRGKAQRVSRPAQTRLQNSMVSWPKFTKFYQTSRRTGDVISHIQFAILPSVAECQRTEWGWGMPVFADSRQNSVTIATWQRPLSDRKGQIDHASIQILQSVNCWYRLVSRCCRVPTAYVKFDVSQLRLHYCYLRNSLAGVMF